jgi:hypothetical protein
MEMSTKKVRLLLQDFANLKPADRRSMERWLHSYRQSLPPAFFSEAAQMEHDRDEAIKAETPLDVVNRTEGRTDDEIHEAALMRLWDLAYKLRRAWDEPTAEDKEWHVDELRRWLYLLTEPLRSRKTPLPPPSPTGFQQALRYFRNHSDMAKHCGNPDCRPPYFFADDPRERYCDDPKCRRWAILRSKKLSARKRRATSRRRRERKAKLK